MIQIMPKRHFTLFTVFIVAFLGCQKAPEVKKGLTSFVNPFIGTGGHGHTFPGATMPFGMVQLSPDTRLDGWDGCSGYHYSDSIVYGFSHTHLSGTGVSDYGDVLLMPTSGELFLESGSDSRYGPGYSSLFEKTSEKAEPGFYETHLLDNDILVSLTTTERAGFHKYKFNKKGKRHIVLDLEHRDKLVDFSIEQVSETQFVGSRVSEAWAKEQHVYFYLEFSKPALQKKRRVRNKVLFRSILGFSFEDDLNEILVKVGISAVSIENAKANLEAEIPHWDFEKTKTEAREAWNKQLSKIEVEGEEEDKVKFYTSLYHTMIAPNLYNDVNGDYRGMDMKIHNIGEGKEQYTIFSLWDTFRATHPLYTLIEQDRTNAFIQTFIRQYEQGGLLPVWELAANETNCMIGYHSVPVIADAFMKGIRDFDADKAMAAMVTSANQDEHGLKFYKAQGCINAGDESESVSKTLAYAYDDWCIAEMALEMNKQETARAFLERSENWKNLYDPSTGFFRARVNNSWFGPFVPEEVNFNYTEANAWQYSLFVPHDIYGLAGLKTEGLEAHLDKMFNANSETSGREQADITGLIGQYAHGNEPSHHMAYLYNYCGRPDKTQELVTEIKNSLYTTEPDGLSGNEDCGQMSAWYVLSAMGFYSVTPGQPFYAIGSPTFREAVINLENGKTFTIKAKNFSKDNFYIQEATLNGEPLAQTVITHDEIMGGGELVFEMGDQASGWGKAPENWPPQKASENFLVPTPYFTSELNTFKDSMQVGVKSLCSECTIVAGFVDEPNLTFRNSTVAINLKEDKEIWAYAEHEDGGISDTIITKFYKLDDKLKLTLKSEYANQYSAGGDHGLIDRQYGTANFRTGSWQGYQGQDFEAELNLGEIKSEVNISIGFLQDIKSWIWYPKKVEFWVYYGDDVIEIYEDYPGKGFEKKEGAMRTAVSVKLEKPSRKIKIVAKSIGPCPDWHLGAGGKSWLFIDEVEVK
jgi:predicted alpha-1,2-mannosidase